MLEVNESTIKRWADQGHMECLRTKGGHRRFPIRSVLKFVHQNRLRVPALEGEIRSDRDARARLVEGDVDALVPEFRSAMSTGNTPEVLRLLRLGVAAKGDLLAVYDQLVFPSLAAIGEAWARGEVTIDVEHLAAQSVREALSRLQPELYQKPANDRTALLACYVDELHDIPLRCVEQYLTSEGWRTLYLGPQTPTDSLVFSISRNRPDLVILSVLVVNDEDRFVSDVNDEIMPALRRVGGRLSIGGPDIARRFSGVLQADHLANSILDVAQVADLPAFERSIRSAPAGAAKRR